MQSLRLMLSVVLAAAATTSLAAAQVPVRA
jgi:hypothetical protein